MRMKTLFRWAFSATLAAALGLTGLPASATLAPPPSYSALYVFGDSLSDPGNVAAAIGSNAGQVISGNGYIPSAPYGSGQFTNGNVWAISLAGMLGLPGASNSYLAGGGNFAYGGAKTSFNGLVPSLLTQVSGIYLPSTGNTASPTALYVVAGGGNDGRDAVLAAAGATDQAAAFGIVTNAATTYAASTLSIVNSLRSAGAQNIVVWNVPNLGLAPAITSRGAAASALGTLVSGSMNAAMQAALATVSAVVPGVRLFDDFGLLSTAVANPASFGFTNAMDACGNPLAACNANLSTALFWDGIHPTAAGHALLAQQMYALAAVPEPATVLMMLAGVLALAGTSHRRKG